MILKATKQAVSGLADVINDFYEVIDEEAQINEKKIFSQSISLGNPVIGFAVEKLVDKYGYRLSDIVNGLKRKITGIKKAHEEINKLDDEFEKLMQDESDKMDEGVDELEQFNEVKENIDETKTLLDSIKKSTKRKKSTRKKRTYTHHRKTTKTRKLPPTPTSLSLEALESLSNDLKIPFKSTGSSLPLGNLTSSSSYIIFSKLDIRTTFKYLKVKSNQYPALQFFANLINNMYYELKTMRMYLTGYTGKLNINIAGIVNNKIKDSKLLSGIKEIVDFNKPVKTGYVFKTSPFFTSHIKPNIVYTFEEANLKLLYDISENTFFLYQNQMQEKMPGKKFGSGKELAHSWKYKTLLGFSQKFSIFPKTYAMFDILGSWLKLLPVFLGGGLGIFTGATQLGPMLAKAFGSTNPIMKFLFSAGAASLGMGIGAKSGIYKKYASYSSKMRSAKLKFVHDIPFKPDMSIHDKQLQVQLFMYERLTELSKGFGFYHLKEKTNKLSKFLGGTAGGLAGFGLASLTKLGPILTMGGMLPPIAGAMLLTYLGTKIGSGIGGWMSNKWAESKYKTQMKMANLKFANKIPFGPKMTIDEKKLQVMLFIYERITEMSTCMDCYGNKFKDHLGENWLKFKFKWLIDAFKNTKEKVKNKFKKKEEPKHIQQELFDIKENKFRKYYRSSKKFFEDNYDKWKKYKREKELKEKYKQDKLFTDFSSEDKRWKKIYRNFEDFIIDKYSDYKRYRELKKLGKENKYKIEGFFDKINKNKKYQKYKRYFDEFINDEQGSMKIDWLEKYVDKIVKRREEKKREKNKTDKIKKKEENIVDTLKQGLVKILKAYANNYENKKKKKEESISVLDTLKEMQKTQKQAEFESFKKTFGLTEEDLIEARIKAGYNDLRKNKRKIEKQKLSTIFKQKEEKKETIYDKLKNLFIDKKTKKSYLSELKNKLVGNLNKEDSIWQRLFGKKGKLRNWWKDLSVFTKVSIGSLITIVGYKLSSYLGNLMPNEKARKIFVGGTTGLIGISSLLAVFGATNLAGNALLYGLPLVGIISAVSGLYDSFKNLMPNILGDKGKKVGAVGLTAGTIGLTLTALAPILKYVPGFGKLGGMLNQFTPMVVSGLMNPAVLVTMGLTAFAVYYNYKMSKDLQKQNENINKALKLKQDQGAFVDLSLNIASGADSVINIRNRMRKLIKEGKKNTPEYYSLQKKLKQALKIQNLKKKSIEDLYQNVNIETIGDRHIKYKSAFTGTDPYLYSFEQGYKDALKYMYNYNWHNAEKKDYKEFYEKYFKQSLTKKIGDGNYGDFGKAIAILSTTMKTVGVDNGTIAQFLDYVSEQVGNNKLPEDVSNITAARSILYDWLEKHPKLKKKLAFISEKSLQTGDIFNIIDNKLASEIIEYKKKAESTLSEMKKRDMLNKNIAKHEKTYQGFLQVITKREKDIKKRKYKYVKVTEEVFDKELGKMVKKTYVKEIEVLDKDYYFYYMNEDGNIANVPLKLTEAEYRWLKENGSITIDGIKLRYNSKRHVFIGRDKSGKLFAVDMDSYKYKIIRAINSVMSAFKQSPKKAWDALMRLNPSLRKYVIQILKQKFPETWLAIERNHKSLTDTVGKILKNKAQKIIDAAKKRMKAMEIKVKGVSFDNQNKPIYKAVTEFKNEKGKTQMNINIQPNNTIQQNISNSRKLMDILTEKQEQRENEKIQLEKERNELEKKKINEQKINLIDNKKQQIINHNHMGGGNVNKKSSNDVNVETLKIIHKTNLMNSVY